MCLATPSELFEPKGVDAMYISFLVNEHTRIYPGTTAILRLTTWTSAATFRLVRLLKSLAPAGLAIDGNVLWAETNPDGSYTRKMISRSWWREISPKTKCDH